MNGCVWTGYNSDCDEKMSNGGKQTLMDTRKKKAEGGTTTNKEKGGKVKSQTTDVRRSIEARKQQSKASDGDDTPADSTDNSDAPRNTGNAFGGCSAKQKKE
jgi:hypothetical protein